MRYGSQLAWIASRRCQEWFNHLPSFGVVGWWCSLGRHYRRGRFLRPLRKLQKLFAVLLVVCQLPNPMNLWGAKTFDQRIRKYNWKKSVVRLPQRPLGMLPITKVCFINGLCLKCQIITAIILPYLIVYLYELGHLLMMTNVKKIVSIPNKCPTT